MRKIWEVIVSDPNVLLLFAAAPFVLAGALIALFSPEKRKRPRIFGYALMAAAMAVFLTAAVRGSRESDAEKQTLRENSLIRTLASRVANHTAEIGGHGGRAVVREPYLVLRVVQKSGTRGVGRTAYTAEITDISYSGAKLTAEAIGEYETICLWMTTTWESKTYVGTGGATVKGRSEKAECWIYDADASAFTETYTLYSAPLPDKVSGETMHRVTLRQVRDSLRERME